MDIAGHEKNNLLRINALESYGTDWRTKSCSCFSQSRNLTFIVYFIKKIKAFLLCLHRFFCSKSVKKKKEKKALEANSFADLKLSFIRLTQRSDWIGIGAGVVGILVVKLFERFEWVEWRLKRSGRSRELVEKIKVFYGYAVCESTRFFAACLVVFRIFYIFVEIFWRHFFETLCQLYSNEDKRMCCDCGRSKKWELGTRWNS